MEGDGASSRDVWVNTNKELVGTPRRSISRASIINFLNDMVDEGILNYHEITGKGGHRRIYSQKYDMAGTKHYLAKKIMSKLLAIWPEAAREAMEATYADESKAAETTEKSRDSSLSLIAKIQRDAKKLLPSRPGLGSW